MLPGKWKLCILQDALAGASMGINGDFTPLWVAPKTWMQPPETRPESTLQPIDGLSSLHRQCITGTWTDFHNGSKSPLLPLVAHTKVVHTNILLNTLQRFQDNFGFSSCQDSHRISPAWGHRQDGSSNEVSWQQRHRAHLGWIACANLHCVCTGPRLMAWCFISHSAEYASKHSLLFTG